MVLALPKNPKPLAEWTESELGGRRIIQPEELAARSVREQPSDNAVAPSTSTQPAARSEREQAFVQHGVLGLPKMSTAPSSEREQSHGNSDRPAHLRREKIDAGAVQNASRVNSETLSGEAPSAPQGQIPALPNHSVRSCTPLPPPTPQAATQQNASMSTGPPSKKRKRSQLEAPQAATQQKNGTASSEAPSKKRKRQRSFAYRCRHGCPRLLSDEGTLRAHHHKVHNCFDKDASVEKCGICTKKFARKADYVRHCNRESMCMQNRHCKEWKVPAPQSAQERADTWAYKKDGPLSSHLMVPIDENGESLEWVVDPESGLRMLPPLPADSHMQDEPRRTVGASNDPVVLDDDHMGPKPTDSKGSSVEDAIVIE